MTQEKPTSRERRDKPSAPSVDIYDLINIAAYYAELARERSDSVRENSSFPNEPQVAAIERQVASAKLHSANETIALLEQIEMQPEVTDGDSAEKAVLELLASLDQISDQRVRDEERIQLESSLGFVRRQKARFDILEEPQFQEWLEAKQKSENVLEQRRRVFRRKDAEARRVKAISDAQTDVAKAFEAKETQENRELIDEVLTNGGIAIHTALPKEYSDPKKPKHGFGTLVEGKRAPGSRGFEDSLHDAFVVDGNRGEAGFDKVYGSQDIHEGVVFKPVDEGATRVSELVSGVIDSMVRNEPAVEMIYRTFGDADFNPETWYLTPESGTRGGNRLVVSIIMPESTAAALQQAGKKDPTVIRQVVKEAVLRTIKDQRNEDVEEAWSEGNSTTFGRALEPPYDAWRQAARDKKSHMYFQDDGATSFDENRVVAF